MAKTSYGEWLAKQTPELSGCSRIKRAALSPQAVVAYRFKVMRPIVRWYISRFEGGAMLSHTLRVILREQYMVEVGDYSYGPCLKPGFLPPRTKIGRYCSFGPDIMIFRRNHPVDRISMHPFFFNRNSGVVENDTTDLTSDNPLEVGHDVWIGARAIILPKCRRIGLGAIIGAGTIVTHDVPDFSIVTGNPGHVMRYRFPPNVQDAVKDSRWWTYSIDQLADHIIFFTSPASSVVRDLLSRLREEIDSATSDTL